MAVQRVHGWVQRLELREWRPDEVGDLLGPAREQRRSVLVLLAADRRPEPAHRGAPDLLGRRARLAHLGLRRRRSGAHPPAGPESEHRPVPGKLSRPYPTW